MSMALVVLLAGACSALAASKPRIRTVAWVNTTCRTDATGITGHQELYVQRGDRAPVVVSERAIAPDGPTPTAAKSVGDKAGAIRRRRRWTSLN